MKSCNAGPEEKDFTTKDVQYKRARETTKIATDPSYSFANEIVALTSAFRTNPSPWILKKLTKLLEVTEEDFDDLRKFLSREATILD